LTLLQFKVIDLGVNRKLILALTAAVFEIFMLKARKWLNFRTPTLVWGTRSGETLRMSTWNLASEN